MNPIWELVDITKLNEKIKEWESQGLSESEIVEEGRKWVKEYLKSIPWSERKAMISRIDRDRKLEEILNNI